MKATTKDLRDHSKELLSAVSRGEEVIITFRGKAQAKLVPLDDNGKKEKDKKLFGMWKENTLIETNVDEHVRKLRKGRY